MRAHDASPLRQKNQLAHPWWYTLIPPSLLVVLTSLFYYPSLGYPFQFDDIANISKKFAIRFDNPFSRWRGSSRWVGEYLNTLNYQIGRFDPFYYRLFNLVIHLLAGLILFYLILDLCKFLKTKPFFYDNRLAIAFSTAALFLLHPVQTQTVSYVIQARLEGLASLFILATLWSYVRIFMVQSLPAKVLLGALFGFLTFLSCGTKELVVVLPFLLLLVDWFFISQETWSKFKVRFFVYLTFAAVFTMLVASYMGKNFFADALRLKLVTGNNRGNILTDHAFDIITPFSYLISQFRVVWHYLTMFVWPVGISVEYDWKLAQSFWSFSVLVPLMLLLTVLGFAVKAMSSKKNSLFAFGLFWFFISVAPRASIIPSPELVCDYKTYLASIGVMFILAVVLVMFVQKVMKHIKDLPVLFAGQWGQVAALAVLVVPLGFASYERNKIWESSIAFWEDNIKKAPKKARVWNNAGVAYSEAGRIDEALVAYKKAIDLDKVYSDPLSNIAVAYSMKGDIDKAIESLKSALVICPNYPEAYNNIGSLLIQKKQYDEAERALDIAIRLRPYYGKAFYNLARLAEEKKDDAKAWEYLAKATEGDLDTPEVFFKFGQMSMKTQKFAEAVQAFEKVVAHGISDSQVWFNLANAYFMTNEIDKAETIYQRLVRDNPLDGRFVYNLGEAYYTKKEFAQALDLFKRATQLPNPLAQSFFRVASCYEQLKEYDEALDYLNSVLEYNAPEEFKKVVKSELTRISLQQKVNEGNGSIKLSDLKQAFALKEGASAEKGKGVV